MLPANSFSAARPLAWLSSSADACAWRLSDAAGSRMNYEDGLKLLDLIWLKQLFNQRVSMIWCNLSKFWIMRITRSACGVLMRTSCSFGWVYPTSLRLLRSSSFYRTVQNSNVIFQFFLRHVDCFVNRLQFSVRSIAPLYLVPNRSRARLLLVRLKRAREIMLKLQDCTRIPSRVWRVNFTTASGLEYSTRELGVRLSLSPTLFSLFWFVPVL